MSIRALITVLLVLAALGLAWQQRAPLQAWFGASVTRVEQMSRSAADPGASKDAPGGLRKCVKGQQVSYTNAACPPGTTEQAVTAGTVTVVPATPVPKASDAASGPSGLHKALDMTRDDTLRDKIMQRQIEGAR